ncbi:carboxypeptidase B-like [Antedon mediterranea]|uniref:carboxypeptidase B-like n=1 Tax=Antedon mediterranea TaxID=105859 RepID=UPI003AF9DB22
MDLRLVCLAAVVVLCAAEPRRYDGYKVFRITPNSDDDMKALKKLKSVVEDKVDFWRDIRAVGSPVDIMVSPQMEKLLANIAKEYKLDVDVAIEDIQPLFDDQMKHSREMSAKGIIGGGSFDYTEYHTLDEINTWIEDIVSTYPALVKKVPVGSSYEGRNIYALKLGSSKLDKPIVWLEGGIHSREWVSPATMIYITHELVSKYGKDTDITTLMDGLHFYIIPVFNVDGYEYTWTSDRMWRKTRSPNNRCVGTDPNRNWDYHWSDPGASANPCSDLYYGSNAFSEIELKSVTNYMNPLKEDIRVFIDFHAYSQMWMSPWSYTKDLPDTEDYNDQINLQAKAVEALTAVYGTKYTQGTIANTIYEASGSSIDWAYGTLGVKYSYAVELRDEGTYGFTLPARFIEPTAIETFEAVKVIANKVNY